MHLILLSKVYSITGKFGGRKLWRIYRDMILVRERFGKLVYINIFVMDEKI